MAVTPAKPLRTDVDQVVARKVNRIRYRAVKWTYEPRLASCTDLKEKWRGVRVVFWRRGKRRCEAVLSLHRRMPRRLLLRPMFKASILLLRLFSNACKCMDNIRTYTEYFALQKYCTNSNSQGRNASRYRFLCTATSACAFPFGLLRLWRPRNASLFLLLNLVVSLVIIRIVSPLVDLMIALDI